MIQMQSRQCIRQLRAHGSPEGFENSRRGNSANLIDRSGGSLALKTGGSSGGSSHGSRTIRARVDTARDSAGGSLRTTPKVAYARSFSQQQKKDCSAEPV